MKETIVYNDHFSKIIYSRSQTPKCNIEIHLHDSYEIFMALTPNIRYHIEGRAYDLDVYDIIITNEKEIHRPVITDSGPYGRSLIQFKPVIFHHFFSEKYNPLSIFENRALGEGNKIELSKLKINPINPILNEMEELNRVKSDKNMLLIKSLLVRLLIELEEIYMKTAAKKDYETTSDERIDGVISELNASFDKPFNLDEISRRHFMDKYYLCHLFKETTGFSLLEYVQSKRIQQAKMLISQGGGIMEAARLSGFEEYSNFYKTFTKIVKVPPKKYKESILALR